MVRKDLDKLIGRYLDGTCTEAERAIVESFYSSLGRNAPPDFSQSAQQDEQLSRRLLNSIESRTRAADDTRLHIWRYSGIAATLVILLLAGYSFLKPSVNEGVTASVADTQDRLAVVQYAGPQKKRVILPDGSIVEMSPESRIRYAPKDEGPVRELFLEGEAYFDVAHNHTRPFFVYAGDVVTRVLGTSFIVRAPGQEEKVTV
jgi:ferric-dicitrate binding protein FerR (iron transport regulator)